MSYIVGVKSSVIHMMSYISGVWCHTNRGCDDIDTMDGISEIVGVCQKEQLCCHTQCVSCHI